MNQAVRRRIRLIVTLGIACVAAELVAFSDFDGAWATDLTLFVVGGSGSSPANTPPPNIMFVFDNSASMQNIVCEELSGSRACTSTNLTAKTVTYGATICTSPGITAARGTDLNGDNILDAYTAVYASDGVTFTGPRYPILDERNSSTNDDLYRSASSFSHARNTPFAQLERVTGTAASDFASVIGNTCNRISDCSRRSRCVHSLRTQGYFWEPTGTTCGTGDPMAMCAACGNGSCDAGESSLTCPGDCVSTPVCGNGTCETGETTATCASDCTASAVCGDGNCSGTETIVTCPLDCASCGDSVCTSPETKVSCPADCPPVCGDSLCTGSETISSCPADCIPARTLGAPCANDGNCNSGECVNVGSKVCSECSNNSDCTGSNTCISTGCTYKHCSNTACVPGGGGGGGGLGGGGLLQVAEEIAWCVAAAAPPAASTDITNPVFLGDFLNFYPPKGVGLVKAFKTAVGNMTGDARMGVSTLDDISSTNLGHEIVPPCSQASGTECFDGDPATQCFNPGNSQLLNYLDNMSFTRGDKPLGDMLDRVGRYFTSSSGVSTPICSYTNTTCATNNYIVMVADGAPHGDPTSASGYEHASARLTGFTNGLYTNDAYWVDDVSRALTRIDHRSDITDNQTVGTYTVSYGPTAPSDANSCDGILLATAVAGDGRCLPAQNVSTLSTVLSQIITEIISRAAGFTAPSIPTTRFTGTSSLANAVFRPATAFPLWEGHLYTFNICDERLARITGDACTCGSSSTDDTCIQDFNGNAIDFDNDGNLVSRPLWDAALCLAGDVANTVGIVPMDQSNLDVSRCFRTSDESATNARKILTAFDSDSDGTIETTEQLPFTVANAGTLQTKLGVASLSEAERLVRFYRGADVDDINGNGNITEDRNLSTMRDGSGTPLNGWWKLGDIFHSIPNAVERPSGRGMGAWAKTASYVAYQTANAARQKVILAGANDGMLHAFQAGTWDATAAGGKGAYNAGTGEELWAFVSPEMITQLKNNCTTSSGGCSIQNHQFMVDGSVMVREIWTGGTADKESAANADKWRTIAVFGHRDGGSTYVGIDVTDVTSPQFLWQFPQPGDLASTTIGKSWIDTFPAPAAIGPIREDTNNDGNVDLERWVVLLNGGFDQLDRKGRALYMLDAYTGAVRWSVGKTTASGTDTDKMSYAFPATPAYYGDLGGPVPYIAGIVAVDHGGQVWHIPTPLGVPTSGVYAFTPQIVFTTRSNTGINTDLVGGNNNSRL
ncbi:MAG TPA: hypothetical protein VLC93_07020, partial [Myxococcota bacterium]|nr:hypothetical protein [Myxococcota bacterium]